MQIRKAVSHDKEQLAKLLIDFNNFAKKSFSAKQNKLRAFKNLPLMWEEIAEGYLSNSKYIVFVVDENNILKGFINGEIRENKYRIYDKEGYVESWFIEEEYRDKGTGKQLFDALTEEFKKLGCTSIGLDTNVENEIAIQIYEHMGFIRRLIVFRKLLQDLP
jgi:ribosomal protein S18 acetylase RimI-like enzyme